LPATKKGRFKASSNRFRERNGKTVRWEEDQAAHEQALQDARQLLRKPLTVDAAVQIALLNNRSLQATFEEIGLSAADLIEAATIPNPRFDLAIRFPDKPPSGTYIDYGAAIDFLSIIMIPLKKRIAKEQLEAAALRIADATLELVSQVKSAFYGEPAAIHDDAAASDRISSARTSGRKSVAWVARGTLPHWIISPSGPIRLKEGAV
jgi:outer membrane protein, heavy metal efflux system